MPEIRLEGNWLKKLGFEIGKEIEIKQQKNKLTITLIEKREK
ncbi:MAG: HSP20-like protein [Flavobacteriaceae bacterium FS1-H7996/R]|nr:MAG: HSP20-like protein [Flavobacteriaceae bacterium FS1-H7996/R]